MWLEVWCLPDHWIKLSATNFHRTIFIAENRLYWSYYKKKKGYTVQRIFRRLKESSLDTRAWKNAQQPRVVALKVWLVDQPLIHILLQVWGEKTACARVQMDHITRRASLVGNLFLSKISSKEKQHVNVHPSASSCCLKWRQEAALFLGYTTAFTICCMSLMLLQNGD